MLYTVLKNSLAFGLYAYHSKIEIHGFDTIPKNKPVLFLPNHQNALLDTLLVAVKCNRKPYFLTRSDIFGNVVLNALFKYVHMIPVYRLRDGRDKLAKNHEVFDTCAKLLERGEAITIFPEANHNLKRRVRPLSKGFTRLLLRALELSPELDIQIVPVGMNYKHALHFPDSVALRYGKPIAVQELFDKNDLLGSTNKIKDTVEAQLKILTTHITPEENYLDILNYLESKDVDFLKPKTTNALIKDWQPSKTYAVERKNMDSKRRSILYPFFIVLNFPVLLLWRFLAKPKVPELEFMGTFRYATGFLGFSMYYGILMIFSAAIWNIFWAVGIISVLFLFNLFYVKSYKF